MTRERCQEIMAKLGMPDSRSLAQALEQVANETAQQYEAQLAEAKWRREIAEVQFTEARAEAEGMRAVVDGVAKWNKTEPGDDEADDELSVVFMDYLAAREAKPAQETGAVECRIYNEDDLPPMSEAEYERWFNYSYVPDGIGGRIGPWPLPEPPR